MSSDKLRLITNGTEFYMVASGFKMMLGIYLHTGAGPAYFVCPEQGIMQASAANIMTYYYSNFLKMAVPAQQDPFILLYVTKGTYRQNALNLLLRMPDVEIAKIGTPFILEPTVNPLDLLPRHCPCYIKIGDKEAWNGIAVHDAPRQHLSSAFFSDDSHLFGATAEEAIKQYTRRHSLTSDFVLPLRHIYLAKGPHKDMSLAYLFEHGSEKTIRDCLKLPLEPSPTIRDDLRRIESANLKSLGKSKVPVRAAMADIGVLEGTLEPDGTFSYDDKEVGHTGLNSFEFLWFLKQRDTNAVMVPLQARIELDPEYALRFIFFIGDTSKSLLQHLDDKATATATATTATIATTRYEGLLERLDAKEKALLAEIKTLEEIEHRQMRIRGLTARRDELKSKIDE